MIEKVIFACGDIKLEGVQHIPVGKETFPAAIICHPHPRFGGNMNNNVVTSVAEKILSSNFFSLRFNFRGVGGSGGISPPLNFFNFGILKNEKRSKFLICGDHDMFISLDKLKSYALRYLIQKNIKLFQGPTISGGEKRKKLLMKLPISDIVEQARPLKIFYV